MRRVVLVALFAAPVLADSRIQAMIDHLNAGRTDQALDEAKPEVMQLLVAMGDMSRECVLAMGAHNERYAGKDDYSCGRVLELAREIRKRALEGGMEERILAAEILLVEGRTARARREADWFASWRAAAQELATWHAGSPSRDRALVRAVQILAEGAELKGAPPADQLLEEARQLVLKDPRGESPESPPWLAYRVCLAEHLAAARRKKEAADALAPFEELAPKLGGRDDDLERATIFNLAVSLSRREGLGLKADFKTTHEKAGHMEFDLPVSYLWSEPRPDREEGDFFRQVAPNGQPVRAVFFGWYQPGVPWDQHTPAPKTLQELGGHRFGAIRNFYMTKITKKGGPSAGFLNRNLPRGLVATFEGVDDHGRAVSSKHLLFEDKKRSPGRFEVSYWVYGARPPEDPLFDAFVASIQ